MTMLRPLVLLLSLAGFVLAGSTVPHLHADGGFGLWNQEHDLSLMAALGTAAAPPDAPPVVALVLVVVLALAPVSFWLAGAPLRLADSRAPPPR
ncbi:MAG: hypothetical protein AABZ83_13575 [candidate division NC10 bacterium]